MTDAYATRVLILEDEPLIAIELQEALEELGYQVIGPAQNCEAALELIWSNKVDAAILDLIIGEGTCEVVANELSQNGVPYAFASGYDAHELYERFPGVPVVPKPSESDRVARMVQSLLNSSVE